MSNNSQPSPDILSLPIEVRAEMAFKAAVDKVIEQHVREGLPIYIWSEGKVVEVAPEDLRQ
jgi:hypothetical protein